MMWMHSWVWDLLLKASLPLIHPLQGQYPRLRLDTDCTQCPWRGLSLLADRASVVWAEACLPTAPIWGSQLCPQRLRGLLQVSTPASLRCRKAPDAASLLSLSPFPVPVVWALSQADSSTLDFQFLIRLEAWERGEDGVVPTQQPDISLFEMGNPNSQGLHSSSINLAGTSPFSKVRGGTCTYPGGQRSVV